MCGICGIAHAAPDRPVDRDSLQRMCDVITHRGPDGAGVHVERGVGLGHRRLSIIDVVGGAQPLSNEDGTVWVSFNGEIYNHRDLASRLAARGHTFRTHSDTEVLVHAYEEWGDGLVRELNGMFAFALHDVRQDRVLLARDHLGIKPLFYRIDGETLLFASEIKALFTGTTRRPRPRRESIQEYLIFRYVAGSNAFHEDVRRLPAGHVAVWEHGRLDLHRFWHPPADETHGLELEPAADALANLLARSVDSQLMSEVPLGAFCSGGVDSGLVSAYAADASPHRLETFAVGFRDPAWDERTLAEDTARRIGASHHTVIAEPEEFCGLLPGLVWYHDEPLSHPNTIPLYQLSRFARQFVTVVLTGEGADELFCGYPRYHIARWRAAANGLPRAVRRPLAAILARSPGHRGAKLGDSLGRDLEDALLFNSAYVSPELVARLTGHPVDGALSERRTLLASARSDSGAVATLSRYELLTYLGCALDRMDRVSMACSLEGRVPFLDIPLVEWAVRLAGKLKLSGTQNKRVVKALARRRLNPAIALGAKSGFGVPLGAWFRSPVLAPLLVRLRDPGHPAADLFDQREVRRLTDEHSAGAADHGEALWLLANVYVWAEINADGVAGQPPISLGAGAIAAR